MTAASIPEKINFLLQGVNARLEESPIEFVEQLIDLFTAPERKRDDALLQDLWLLVWLISECPEAFAELAGLNDALYQPSRVSMVKPYDSLVQFLCALIEQQITNHLASSQLKEFAQFNSKVLQIFWGGLTLHLKLMLPLDPCCGPPLYSNGVVRLSDGETFPCEPPLSESQIFALLTTLGPAFVAEYAASYVRQEKLRAHIARLDFKSRNGSRSDSKKETEPLELLVQERTLNRYVDKFAKRLAAHFRAGCMQLAKNPNGRLLELLSVSTIETVKAQILKEISSTLFVEPRTMNSSSSPSIAELSVAPLEVNVVARPGSNLGDAPDGHPSAMEELLESAREFQQNSVRDSHCSKFVPPNLEYIALKDGARHFTTVDELADSTPQRVLITAPPDGGKTRLQQELMLRTRESPVQPIGVNLKDFARSGLHSFHRFAARQISRQSKHDFGTLTRLENELLALDHARKIHWHMDGWDDLSEADRSRLVSGFAPIAQFTLSTSAPRSVSQFFHANGIPFDGVVRIHPFTAEQIREFIRVNHGTHSTRLARRAISLFGLASLPGGLEYLCQHPEYETVVDVLLGYLNRLLQNIGEPLFDGNDLIFDGFREMMWQSELLADAYSIVKAISAADRKQPDVTHIQVHRILPFMGADNAAQNYQLAEQRIERCVHAKLLTHDDNEQDFRFVVREIGLLLTAISQLAPIHGERWLDYALGELGRNPDNPHCQMMVALASWHQEKLLLRNGSLAASGTIVPNLNTQPF